MAAIFPPLDKGGVPPASGVCNGYTPINRVVGEGPLYISPDCSTVLTDCQLNAIVSEILAAVDELGFAYNSTRITNLGDALTAAFQQRDNDIAARVLRSGDTMTGPLELSRDPETDMEAANKRYVDDQDATTLQAAKDFATAADDAQQQIIDGKVSISGDAMTGPLYLASDPTVAMQAATKQYVDDRDDATLQAANAYTDQKIAEIPGADKLVIVAATPPQGMPPNTLWWDSTIGHLFILYDDGNSIQWVSATALGGGGVGQHAGVLIAPEPPESVPGTLWWNSTNGILYVRYDDGTTVQWVAVGGGFVTPEPETPEPEPDPALEPSDARIKDVHGDYAHGLEQIEQLRPVTYSLKLDARAEAVGLIAQEVETIMPELVKQSAGVIDGQHVDDFRTLDQRPLIFALINAVKELSARVKALEAANA